MAQVAREPDPQMVEAAQFLFDRVEVEQRLGWMIPGPVSGVDDRHGRDPSRPLGGTDLGMTKDDPIRIATDDADGVLQRFPLGRGRGMGRVLGTQDLSAEPVHGGLEGKPRPGARLVEDGRQQPPRQWRSLHRHSVFEGGGTREQVLDQGTIEGRWIGQMPDGNLRPRGRSGQGVSHRILLSVSLDRVKGRSSRSVYGSAPRLSNHVSHPVISTMSIERIGEMNWTNGRSLDSLAKAFV